MLYIGVLLFVLQLADTNSTAPLFTSGAFHLALPQEGSPWGTVAQIPISAIRALVATLFGVLLIWILHRISGRRVLTRVTYPIFLVLFSSSIVTLRFAFSGQGFAHHGWSFAALLLRGLILGALLIGVLGMLEQRFTAQARRADAAAALIAVQRSAVLESEERARRSIARLLHDKVQAGIVAASLQLMQVRPQASSEVADRISDVISNLERIRSQDLRAAARQLSPDIAHMHLSGVLEELARSYTPAMDVLIDVRTEIAHWRGLAIDAEQAKLGCYRIVEQALLNSAVHGKAAHVTVVVDHRTSADRQFIEIVITDDGLGLPASITPGTGSAVIDAWVDALNAMWAIGPGAFGGAEVSIHIPVAQAASP